MWPQLQTEQQSLNPCIDRPESDCIPRLPTQLHHFDMLAPQTLGQAPDHHLRHGSSVYRSDSWPTLHGFRLCCSVCTGRQIVDHCLNTVTNISHVQMETRVIVCTTKKFKLMQSHLSMDLHPIIVRAESVPGNRYNHYFNSANRRSQSQIKNFDTWTELNQQQSLIFVQI